MQHSPLPVWARRVVTDPAAAVADPRRLAMAWVALQAARGQVLARPGLLTPAHLVADPERVAADADRAAVLARIRARIAAQRQARFPGGAA